MSVSLLITAKFEAFVSKWVVLNSRLFMFLTNRILLRESALTHSIGKEMDNHSFCVNILEVSHISESELGCRFTET